MKQENRKPIIGIVCCNKELNKYKTQSANKLYTDAVIAYGGIPILLPTGLEIEDLRQLVGNVHGLFFTGSHSNVAPYRYKATHYESYMDELRDELSFNLINFSVERGIPAIGVCRGFQEMNVALGGSLYPKVHESGFDDHREIEAPTLAERYVQRHDVIIEENGCFSTWFGSGNNFQVNSLHNQGVNQLAPTLIAEAKAPDGLIEAFSIKDHPYFVGVQWHPEWQAENNAVSKQLFTRFIEASRIYSDIG